MEDGPAANLKRTRFARMGVDFAALFTAGFWDRKVAGYTPFLREPPGDSTGGGKQATQHFVLEGEGSTITFGSVNVATKQCRVRTYDCLERLHARRFRNKPLPIPRDAYDQLVGDLQRFVKMQAFEIEMETEPPDVPGAEAATGGRAALAWVLFALLVIAVGAAAFFFLRTTR